ncbi:MAG TPA: ClpXP protease specificity-enhancing factor SspB [Hyphomicrobium sp.]|nr:ClpXP protease specificity-enhancing factor SspB [Hyphomicrobium sp.]
MIDYEALQQDALRGIIRAALQQIAKTGLPGEHHFYISFLTQAPGVVLSKRLKEKYPHEMTIVLQHRFWDLIVSDDRFEVKLTFDGVPERLVVPLSAIKVFIDPSVHFGLQFEDMGDRPQTAARRSMTMDAAYDAVSDVRPDSPRATLAKKPRSPRKTRAEKETAQEAARAGAHDEPPLPPQPEPASAAAGGGVSGDTAAAAEAPQGGEDKAGAKVVSLDAFRKK